MPNLKVPFYKASIINKDEGSSFTAVKVSGLRLSRAHHPFYNSGPVVLILNKDGNLNQFPRRQQTQVKRHFTFSGPVIFKSVATMGTKVRARKASDGNAED